MNIELTDLRKQKSVLIGSTPEEAQDYLHADDPVGLDSLNGQYSLCHQGDNFVRFARSIAPPLRYAVVEHKGGSHVVVGERIADIIGYVKEHLPDAEFDYTWTRMVPPFTMVQLDFENGKYARTRTARYIKPEPQPADIGAVGEAYGLAVYEAIKGFLRQLSQDDAVGIPLSGGADSGLVYILAAKASREFGKDAADLVAYTVSIERSKTTVLNQARTVNEFVRSMMFGYKPLSLYSLEINRKTLPGLREIVETIEDYKTVWDLQGARIIMAGRKKAATGIPTGDKRYPPFCTSFTMSGHGGDELWQDYPLEEAGTTFDEVLDNPHLYVEGRIHQEGRVNPMFSGGLGRRVVIDPAAQFGFTEFSPLETPGAVKVAYGTPKRKLVSTPEELYKLKGAVASVAVKALTGFDYEFPPKKRFQHDSCSPETFAQHFGDLNEKDARRLFHEIMTEKMQRR